MSEKNNHIENTTKIVTETDDIGRAIHTAMHLIDSVEENMETRLVKISTWLQGC